MVLGACHNGTEVDTMPPKEAREVEASIVPEEALMESVPAPIDAPKVGQTRGGD